MKFIKYLPTLTSAVVLAACSTVSDAADSTVSAVSNTSSTMIDSAKTAGRAVINTAKDAGTAVSNGVSKMKNNVTGSKTQTVNYICSANGKKVPMSATYTFKNGKPEAVTVFLNKRIIGKNLPVDSSYTDGTQFTDSKKVWTLSDNITANTANTIVPVMFVIKNSQMDDIVAKYCSLTK